MPDPHQPIRYPGGETDVPTDVVRRPGQRINVMLFVAGLIFVVGAAAIGIWLDAARRDRRAVYDSLSLFQAAKEMHQHGQDNAALEMLRRARSDTRNEPALREIDRLEREIAVPLKEEPKAIVRPEVAHNFGPSGGDATNEAASLSASRGASTLKGQPNAHATDQHLDLPNRSKVPRRAHSRRYHSSANNPAALNRSAGQIAIESDIPGSLRIDGQATPLRAPSQIMLPPGPHSVSLIPQNSSLAALTQHVNVLPGRRTRLRFSRALAQASQGETSPRQTPPAIGTMGHRKAAIGLVGQDNNAAPPLVP